MNVFTSMSGRTKPKVSRCNGKEFASHESVAETLQIKVYFADPYSAWQRGLNENTNGLIRQYVPKGSEVRSLTDR